MRQIRKSEVTGSMMILIQEEMVALSPFPPVFV